MSPRWLHWPAAVAGADYTDYMTSNSGASYVTFASSTSSATALTFTGSSSVMPLKLLTDADNTYIDTVDSNTVTTSYGFRGYLASNYSGSGFSQPSDTYLAAYFSIYSTYDGAQANGWIVFKLSDGFVASSSTNAYWLPIEAKSGVTASSTQYASGCPQRWTATTSQNLIIFAMNSYTLGDVQGWTDWDGSTTP